MQKRQRKQRGLDSAQPWVVVVVGGRAPFDLLCVGVQLGLTFLVLEEGQAALLSKKDWAVLVDGPSVFILCS